MHSILRLGFPHLFLARNAPIENPLKRHILDLPIRPRCTAAAAHPQADFIHLPRERAVELHLGKHHWEAHMPDWPAALVAGFLAGALLMILEMLWAMTGSGDPWAVAHKVAGITLGADVATASGFSVSIVTIALLTHYVLGMLFGCVLAMMLSAFRLDDSPGMAFALGGAFGIVLYVVNFYLLSRAYPWFIDMRTLETFMGHVIFGMVAGFVYWKMRRQGVG